MKNMCSGPLTYLKRNPIPILSCILALLFIAPYAGADTTVGGTISSDTTWVLSESPYLVTSNITIKGTDGADAITTLTIEPGVTVKFKTSKSLMVGAASGDPGALVAQGTPTNPVTFTSNQGSPAAGDWYGIKIYDTSDDATTRLEHCIIAYPGKSGYTRAAAVEITNAAPSLVNCSITDSYYYDLAYAGTVGGTVSGCTLNSGIYLLATSSVDFTGNTFNHNSTYPTRVNADDVDSLVNGNTFSNLDADSYLELNSGDLAKDSTWTAAIPIYVRNGITIQGTDGPDGITTLTIEPGATLRFKTSKSVEVGAASGDPGALVAQGTAANPVTFTSNQGSPAAGDWYGIKIYDTSDDATTRLEHCIIAYPGKSGYRRAAAVEITNAAPSLVNCSFTESHYYDLAYAGTVGGTVSGCTINRGIMVSTTSTVQFTENTINYDNTYPIKAWADNVHSLVNGNTYHNLDAGSCLEVNSGSLTKDSTWTAAIPLLIRSHLTVQGADGDDAITTLTIEPGATIKFRGRRKFIIGGSSGAPGALIAHGATENMILFTSSDDSPEPSDWYGITFAATASENSMIDSCVIEYGGYSGGGIYLDNRKVPITNSIVRNNGGGGLYVKGANCNGVNIQCNTFENNYNGIYVTGALPNIENNNFINNSYCGLRSYGSTNVIAENNWWNNAAGPNQGGDTTMGNVDATPWSTEVNQCASSSANNPPHEPTDPSPADNAVRVGLNNAKTLTWAGGDPDSEDIVVYDIYIGPTADTLVLDAQDTAGTSHVINDPTPGITYYWQVKARDNHGEEVTGPVWRYTVNGDRPDLTIANVVTNPLGNLQAGQDIAITATIHNNGAGPMVDSFVVDFKVDGSSIGTSDVTEIMLAGQSVELSVPWSYDGGNPTIDIWADSSLIVIEDDEQNNQFSAVLNDIADMTAPTITHTTPEGGAYLQQITAIAVTLADSQSAVDDTAVISDFTVTDSNQQSVPGVVSEENDSFIFAPNIAPMADGTYTVSLVAVDIHGNAQNHSFPFTVDSQPPEKPVITGGTVTSGTIQARPAQNTSDQFMVELTGTREADTAVLINGVQMMGTGDTPWSIQVQLQAGDNTVEANLKDRAGNIGASEWIDIFTNTSNAVQFEYDAAGRVKRIDADQ